MGRRFIAMALVGILIGTNSFAVVPTQALTFGTNVAIINANSTMTDKILKAEELIKRVIATDAFRDRVLNHTYNGVKTYVDNGGHTNEQIYQKMLDGAENLNRVKNNVMDLEIEMYYTYSSTVGYTNSGSPRIYANTRFYDNYSSADITGNMIHEWLHKLGFSHAFYYSTSRDYSVPYAIGSIMSELAYRLPATVEYITAASNLTITNALTVVALTWGPASSSNGISEYKIYRRLPGSTTNYLQGSTTSLKFTQARPVSNATYYVRAIDSTGKTAKSTEVNYVQLTAVNGLALTKTTSNIYLKWSAALTSAGVKEYKIFRRRSGSTTNYLQGTTTSLNFTQARPNSSAVYYVRAVDVNGESMKSQEIQFVK